MKEGERWQGEREEVDRPLSPSVQNNYLQLPGSIFIHPYFIVWDPALETVSEFRLFQTSTQGGLELIWGGNGAIVCEEKSALLLHIIQVNVKHTLSCLPGYKRS